MLFGRKNLQMPEPADALPGRADTMPVPDRHEVLGTPLKGPFPEGSQQIVLGLGCFWGGEELFWEVPGVITTAVGYLGGFTPNPTYEEVCTGRTGHNEVTLVVFDPEAVSLEDLLKVFWESHDPTQGMGQGGDIGTQYRSGIYVSSDEQRGVAEASLDRYQGALTAAGRGTITTEIADAGEFFYAEPYHQQYLAKVANGYRCHSKTGVSYPVSA